MDSTLREVYRTIEWQIYTLLITLLVHVMHKWYIVGIIWSLCKRSDFPFIYNVMYICIYISTVTCLHALLCALALWNKIEHFRAFSWIHKFRQIKLIFCVVMIFRQSWALFSSFFFAQIVEVISTVQHQVSKYLDGLFTVGLTIPTWILSSL